MIKIAFVCLGNICRSPIAEAIGKDIAKKFSLDLHIESFGTASWHIGKSPCENSQKIVARKGLDISKYKGSQITRHNIQDYDFILGADSSVISDLQNISKKDNIHLMGDFGCQGRDVPDPYYFNSIEGFDEVYSMIETCVDGFLNSKYIQK